MKTTKMIAEASDDQISNFLCEEHFLDAQTPTEQNSTPNQKSAKYRKWTQDEKDRYITFIEENSDSFKSEYQRRSEKIFLEMKKVIQTKSSEQCRSHHQKMMKAHKSILKIIKHHGIKKGEKKKRQIEKLRKEEKKRLRNEKKVSKQRKEEEQIIPKPLEIEEIFESESNYPNLPFFFDKRSQQELLNQKLYDSQ